MYVSVLKKAIEIQNALEELVKLELKDEKGTTYNSTIVDRQKRVNEQIQHFTADLPLLLLEVKDRLSLPNQTIAKRYVHTLISDLDKQLEAAKHTLNGFAGKPNDKRFNESIAWKDVLLQTAFFQWDAMSPSLSSFDTCNFFCYALYQFIHAIEVECHYHAPELFPDPDKQTLDKFLEMFAKKKDDLFLFQPEEVINACFGVLVNVGLINDKHHYLGGEKGAFKVWLDLLKNLIKDGSPVIARLSAENYAAYLRKQISGLNISSSILRKNHRKATDKYEQLMKIELARFSHLFSTSK